MGTFVLQGYRPFLAQLHAAAMRFFGQSNRPVATTPDRAKEAAKLRRYAESFMQSDRSFADDLFAAANRHERGG